MESRTTLRRTWLLVATLVAALLPASPAGASDGFLYVTSDTTLSEDHQGRIVIAADDVTLDCAGHAIDGDDHHGIVVQGRTGVVVENCEIFDTNQAILVGSTTDSAFKSNSIHDVRQGVIVEESSTGNSFVGNRIVDAYDYFGFLVISGADANTFVDNTLLNIPVGFLFVGTGGHTVKGNAVSNGGSGFEFLGSHGNAIKGNSAVNEGRGFVLGEGAAANSLRGNVAEGGDFGFHVSGGANHNTLHGNAASGASADGFLIDQGASGNTIKGNSAHDNGRAGIRVQGSDSNLIAQNESHDNVEDGILVLSSNGNSVERNRATGNGVSGIAVIWVAQTMVGRNVSDANGQWGFSALVTDGSQTVIAQNSACGNGNADGVDFGPNNQIFGHFAPASWTNNEFCTPLRYFWEAEGG